MGNYEGVLYMPIQQGRILDLRENRRGTIFLMSLERVHSFGRRRWFDILKHPLTVAGVGMFWLTSGAIGAPMQSDEGMWAYPGLAVGSTWTCPLSVVGGKQNAGIFLLYAISDLLAGHQVWFRDSSASSVWGQRLWPFIESQEVER